MKKKILVAKLRLWAEYFYSNKGLIMDYKEIDTDKRFVLIWKTEGMMATKAKIMNFQQIYETYMGDVDFGGEVWWQGDELRDLAVDDTLSVMDEFPEQLILRIL